MHKATIKAGQTLPRVTRGKCLRRDQSDKTQTVCVATELGFHLSLMLGE